MRKRFGDVHGSRYRGFDSNKQRGGTGSRMQGTDWG